MLFSAVNALGTATREFERKSATGAGNSQLQEQNQQSQVNSLNFTFDGGSGADSVLDF